MTVNEFLESYAAQHQQMKEDIEYLVKELNWIKETYNYNVADIKIKEIAKRYGIEI